MRHASSGGVGALGGERSGHVYSVGGVEVSRDSLSVKDCGFNRCPSIPANP